MDDDNLYIKKYKIKMSTNTIEHQTNKENYNNLNESNSKNEELNYKLFPTKYEQTGSKSFKSLFNDPIMEVLKENEVSDLKNVRLINKKETNLEIDSSDEEKYGIKKHDYKKIEISMVFLIKNPNKVLSNIISSVENESSLSKSRRQMLSKQNDKKDGNLEKNQDLKISENIKGITTNNQNINNNTVPFNPFASIIPTKINADFGNSKFGILQSNDSLSNQYNNPTYNGQVNKQEFPTQNPFKKLPEQPQHVYDNNKNDNVNIKNPFLNVIPNKIDYTNTVKDIDENKANAAVTNPFAMIKNNIFNNTQTTGFNNISVITDTNSNANVSSNMGIKNPFLINQDQNKSNPFLSISNNSINNSIFNCSNPDLDDEDNELNIANPEEEIPIDSNNVVIKNFEEVKKQTICLYKVMAEKLSIGLVEKKLIEGCSLSIESSPNSDVKEKILVYRNKAGNILFSCQSIINKTECKEASIKDLKAIINIGPVLNLATNKFDNIRFSVPKDNSNNIVREINKSLI